MSIYIGPRGAIKCGTDETVSFRSDACSVTPSTMTARWADGKLLHTGARCRFVLSSARTRDSPGRTRTCCVAGLRVHARHDDRLTNRTRSPSARRAANLARPAVVRVIDFPRRPRLTTHGWAAMGAGGWTTRLTTGCAALTTMCARRPATGWRLRCALSVRRAPCG